MEANIDTTHQNNLRTKRFVCFSSRHPNQLLLRSLSLHLEPTKTVKHHQTSKITNPPPFFIRFTPQFKILTVMTEPEIRSMNHKKTPVQAACGGSTHYHVGGRDRR